MAAKRRLGVLISGRGSNMEAILRAAAKKSFPAVPAVVISSRPDAAGLKTAKKMGVETATVASRGFSGTRAAYDRLLMAELDAHGVGPRTGIVCLAGFMRIIGPEFVRRYKNRVLNIHPALLPSFPGLGAQEQAVRYGAKVSGCTVHFVDEGTDTGPVIMQAAVQVQEGEGAESLSRRILVEEHRIYPQALSLVASGMVRVRGRRATVIKGPARQKNTAR